MTGSQILHNLGGQRFQALTGARDFVWQNDSVSFRVPSARTGIARIRVSIAPNDTYTVTFWDNHWVEVATVGDLYPDQLRATLVHHIGCQPLD